jgi:hypothetical protein
MVSRTGRKRDRSENGAENRSSFQEIEFSRIVEVPDKHAGRDYPAYYRSRNGRLKIVVSLPVHRRRIDRSRSGNFYYPLQTPDSGTGCTISVSAPFDLNNDRSSLLANSWNEWLIDEAAALTVDLLKGDWFQRFGADAFKALLLNGRANPSRFMEEIARLLKENACWPTRGKGEEHFNAAAKMVIPSDPMLDGFLNPSQYLDESLSGDSALCDLAAASGAKHFVLPSLVRLRCAGADGKGLQTKLKETEANFHFPAYDTSLKDPVRQAKMAATLSGMARRLSKANKADLSATVSTLTATGDLRRATELITVGPDIWGGCPEPLANRLHPDLVRHKAIASICRRFDEDSWLIDAAARATSASDDDPERNSLYAKLLVDDAPISRAALAAIRKSPVVRNQRMEWTRPAEMVVLRGALARFMAPVVNAPSQEMLGAPNLLARLRIRDRLNGTDLVRYAAAIHERPETAERFEKLLIDNIRLLSSAIVDQLRELPCLRARSGRLATPASLHLDTPTNRLCLGNLDCIMAGGNEPLYRKLRVREVAHSDTLLAVIDAARDRTEPPIRPDLLYPALAAAIARERRSSPIARSAGLTATITRRRASWLDRVSRRCSIMRYRCLENPIRCPMPISRSALGGRRVTSIGRGSSHT